MQNPKKMKASETSTQQRQVTPRNTLHQVAVPNGYICKKDSSIHGTLMNPIFKGESAKNYSFKLDEFEEICVSCLERQELMVSAHTSAYVVEYAIAMALRDKQKLIYTSPLAALINRRYIELDLMSGGDVDLMTGDESLSPTSSCLVMTTEILRKVILRTPEILDDVACVLFDDVHYIKVRERGLVLEEIIMLLPGAIKMVFLSATMSNAFEFAQWICNIRRQPCHVVHTGFRPTPLRHYAYPLGFGRKILLVDEAKEFIQANFLKLQNKITEEKKQKQIEKDLKWENEIKSVVKDTPERYRLIKFDDDSKRYVESGEYIQMSGRAGLRGQEECGECIIMIDEQIEMNTLRDMVLGEPAPLVSAFRLSFNLMLNLMGQCQSQFNAEHLIKNSFIQFQAKQVQKLSKEIQQLNTTKADSQLEKFRVELKNRLEVLKKLEHIDAQHNLTVKGRAARLIRTGDELLAIEAINNATFSDLDAHEIAALASCFIPGYKSQQVIKVSSKLDERLENLRATARGIAQIQHECKLEVDVEEYVEAIVSPVLMNAIYSWATGSSFSDIPTQTDIWEGDIISLARRLHEFLNQLCGAAQAVGKAILAEKFVAAGESIHRGISEFWISRQLAM